MKLLSKENRNKTTEVRKGYFLYFPLRTSVVLRLIVSALKNYNNEKIMNDLKEQVLNLMKKFPLEIEGYNE